MCYMTKLKKSMHEWWMELQVPLKLVIIRIQLFLSSNSFALMHLMQLPFPGFHNKTKLLQFDINK